MGFETQDVARKVTTILKVLDDTMDPLGARVIAHHLQDFGIELGERAVRYHLKLMDEQGLTRLVGRRDGRVITEKGREEIASALVKDKVGFAISKIDLLAFRTTFDPGQQSGLIPVNVSFFPQGDFRRALRAMKPAFDAGLAVSDLVRVADEGQSLGDLVVPQGKMGLATVCSIVFNGVLLRASVPVSSRFAGILQMRNRKPLRFVELIHYAGCSLDPSSIFIRARMTTVTEVIKTGNGNLLANFREIPAPCRPLVDDIMAALNRAGLRLVMAMGDPSEPVCEVSMEMNKIGMVLMVGLNPVALAEETGIAANNHTMSTVMEYQDLMEFREVLRERD
ncbi:DUF128 domain-containing protein [Chloroflexota bacterium]